MQLSALVRTTFGAFFIALVSAVFAISFAAIIYTGELAQYLDRGIGLTLLGSFVIAVTGAFTLSFRGSILAPQDVPAILLAGAAATFVAAGELSGEELFATIACLIVVASLATGAAGLLIGQMKLAYIARFVPYPVLAGFLAATGLLLLIGGIGVAVGSSVNAGGWAVYVMPDTLFKWLPALVAAVTIVIATRVFRGHITLPLALIATAVGYYILFWVFGLSMAEAREKGLLLGPFQDGGFLLGIDPALLIQADWLAIMSQAPVILTIIATAMIGKTLNASGLELAFRRDFDISREVKGAGIANMISACVGGLPGYHSLSESILANRLGLVGPIAGISSGVGCALVLLLGAGMMSALPVGLFAAVIAFLGLDLLYTWLWEERRRLGMRDYAIVVLIPIIAVTYGFLTAIAVGLLAACAFFVIAYAKLDLIRSHSNLAGRRSCVERPDTELRILAEAGLQARIVELSGFLFFGSSNVLRQRMQTVMDGDGPQVRWLVIDFKHVTGVDVSTLRVLQRLVSDCAQREVHLTLASLTTPVESELRECLGPQDVGFFSSLDEALVHLEDTLLAQTEADDLASEESILNRMEALFTENTLDGYAEQMTLDAGAVVVESGAFSNDIYLLRSGQLKVVVSRSDGQTAVVAQIRPGFVVGEMAYYSGRSRSADIIADAPSELLRIDMDRMETLERDQPEIASVFHKLIARDLARRLNRTTTLLRDLGV
ncbi:SLC26A/SulP transporter family protein [Pelagibius litoralis]|uniref:SLC26A/SulP transporter family protein n=1 Tax=Pelagibius litoralis TaxID=374515 RepID=A0A967EYN6_9PROT|nr:SulP family inorganic anion transporter [Pelagibius litoralis]NIA69866.1 SLC26A/SulP transporter family protein [Pelagibius litoralis]